MCEASEKTGGYICKSPDVDASMTHKEHYVFLFAPLKKSTRGERCYTNLTAPNCLGQVRSQPNPTTRRPRAIRDVPRVSRRRCGHVGAQLGAQDKRLDKGTEER